MKWFSLLGFCLSLMVSFNSIAHTDEYLDSQPSPHGGQVRMVGNYHFELVVEEKHLTVYVTDHAGQPVAVKDATGQATVLVNKTKETVVLKPEGENVLKGEGQLTLDPEMKVIVSITFSGQEAQQARFTPLQKKSVKSKDTSTEHAPGHHSN